MAKLSERQININTQFGEDLVGVKTQLLFLGQAVGSLIRLTDSLLGRLQARGLVAEDDQALRDYRWALQELARLGFRAEPPVDPEARVAQVRCPNCNAVIKAKPGQQLVERCDWCGHQFEGR
ncbi:MAG TPA: hypothetical protein PK668_24850 [Myxococcota bacterium]|nr:hypothetical protein [Myxococcota bacterium]HRY96830.1 hypothetical protein [Myxococcota bacterium]HSA21684.1 hypothetical protein [Myxococcota bacterium]